LLRSTQGDLNIYKENLRYMIERNDFIKDSLFCEFGYIINLETNELEIYKGGQKAPQENRYQINTSETGYYNCALVKIFSLNDIPEDWLSQLPDDEEEYDDEDEE
jgi:hypothetical protein